MMFDITSIKRLRDIVGTKLSQKRFIHTLGVERMASYLGNIIIPQQVSELSVAALLHDIAKEKSFEEHLLLIKNSNAVSLDDELIPKPALHSFAAVKLIQEEFTEYATNDILSAAANHTLGYPGMSVFDEIIFISDYSEEGRTYPTCVKVRSFLLENVQKCFSYEKNLNALHRASLMAIDATLKSLELRGEEVGERTLLTREYLELKLK